MKAIEWLLMKKSPSKSIPPWSLIYAFPFLSPLLLITRDYSRLSGFCFLKDTFIPYFSLLLCPREMIINAGYYPARVNFANGSDEFNVAGVAGISTVKNGYEGG